MRGDAFAARSIRLARRTGLARALGKGRSVTAARPDRRASTRPEVFARLGVLGRRPIGFVGREIIAPIAFEAALGFRVWRCGATAATATAASSTSPLASPRVGVAGLLRGDIGVEFTDKFNLVSQVARERRRGANLRRGRFRHKPRTLAAGAPRALRTARR